MEARIVYNVTNKVTHPIHENWLQWLKQQHIPAILATGCFFNASVFRLKGVDDEEGPTYVVQYFANSNAEYEQYLSHFAAAFRQEGIQKWGEEVIAFRTVMELVH